MLSVSFSQRIIRHAKGLDRRRRELQALSSEVLAASKRAIFALHRGDAKSAKQLLDQARKAIVAAHKIVKSEPRLAQEGMWRAAQEEFSEASLFSQYVERRRIAAVAEIGDDAEIYLGALSDLTGEILRRAVLLASERRTADVERMHRDVSEAVEFLLQMDLTGNLRQKVDQARQNLRKLEEIRYDLSLNT